LAAAAAVIVAMAPASAQAGNVVVPHVATPQKVEPHVIHAAPTPTPVAPVSAPKPAPAPSYSAPSAPPASASASGRGQSSAPDGEEELPGSDVPPGDYDPPYPEQLPSPFGSGCGTNCLQRWHDWYFPRIQTVRGEDPEAADLLREELAAIDDQIRDNGGVPGEGPSDGPADEPGDLGPGADSGSSAQGPAQPSSPPPAATQAPAGGSPGEIIVDAITGAGPVIGGDLGSFDLGTPLEDFYELFSAPGRGPIEALMPMLEGFFGAGSGSGGTTACSKMEIEGEVPLCPS
jgi:hypothetical protein